LVDKDEKSLEDLRSFMQEVFRPKYEMTKLCSELSDLKKIHNACIIANHIFDDLILDMYCIEHSLSTKKLYTDESYLKDTWNKIFQDTVFL